MRETPTGRCSTVRTETETAGDVGAADGNVVEADDVGVPFGVLAWLALVALLLQADSIAPAATNAASCFRVTA